MSERKLKRANYDFPFQARQLLRALIRRASISEACRGKGAPSSASVYKWAREIPDFRWRLAAIYKFRYDELRASVEWVEADIDLTEAERAERIAKLKSQIEALPFKAIAAQVRDVDKISDQTLDGLISEIRNY